MKALDLQSEQFQPTGSMAGRGVRQQLGRPELDPLALLVREAAQNSWDARIPGSDRIGFGVRVRRLARGEREVLRSRVFADHPANLPFELLDEGDLAAMTVYDYGTTGLGGPTRANRVSDEDDHARDFVDFLRNVGHPPDKERGGGTYGFGKAVFYTLSRLRTVCVYTRTVSGKRRFMAAALGDEYEDDSPGSDVEMFTGRHWWGEEQADGIVDPLTGAEADELARSIGMPRLPDSDETGTVVTVLAPKLGESDSDEPRTLRDAALFVREVLLWYLWPKMIDTSTCRMDISVRAGDQGLEVPNPEEYPPLEGFVDAMRAAKARLEGGKGSAGGRIEIEEIEHGNTRKRLGVAAAAITSRSERSALPGAERPMYLPIGDTTHHIALMRTPELVVKYLPGPELPQDLLEYAGVFRADDERDRSFAESEPPAHDDWVPDSVEDRAMASNVRVAVRKTREFMQRVVEPHTDDLKGAATAPLGAFARSLGSLLSTSGTGGGEVRAGNSGPSGGSTRGGHSGGATSRVRRVQRPEYETIDGQPVVRFFFEIDHAESAGSSRVEASPLVALDDGTTVEREPPGGSSVPEIVRWEGPNGERREGDRTIEIADEDGTWSVVLTIPEEVSVGVDITAEAVVE